MNKTETDKAELQRWTAVPQAESLQVYLTLPQYMHEYRIIQSRRHPFKYGTLGEIHPQFYKNMSNLIEPGDVLISTHGFSLILGEIWPLAFL